MTRTKSRAIGAAGPGSLAWSEGDFVSEIPDLRHALAGLRIDIAEFGQWLAPHLAHYRASARAAELKGQQAAIIAWLRTAADQIDDAMRDGRLQRLPEFFATPAVEHAAMRAGTTWRQVLAKNDRDLAVSLLRTGIAALERQPIRRGRRPEIARDLLLQCIVQELSRASAVPTVADAEYRADLVLKACGVPSPEASVSRAIRRAKGQ